MRRATRAPPQKPSTPTDCLHHISQPKGLLGGWANFQAHAPFSAQSRRKVIVYSSPSDNHTLGLKPHFATEGPTRGVGELSSPRPFQRSVPSKSNCTLKPPSYDHPLGLKPHFATEGPTRGLGELSSPHPFQHSVPSKSNCTLKHTHPDQRVY